MHRSNAGHWSPNFLNSAGSSTRPPVLEQQPVPGIHFECRPAGQRGFAGRPRGLAMAGAFFPPDVRGAPSVPRIFEIHPELLVGVSRNPQRTV